jgi:hypothetical protein
VLYELVRDLPSQVMATAKKNDGKPSSKAWRDKIRPLVVARLKELGKTRQELGEALAYDNDHPYQQYYKVFGNGRKAMDDEIRQRAADFLRWPVDKLVEPQVDEARNARYQANFERFLREGGEAVAEDIKRTLKSMQFFGDKIPGPDGIRFLAMTLESVIGDRPIEHIADSIRLHSELEHVPEPLRPPKGAPKGPRGPRKAK